MLLLMGQFSHRLYIGMVCVYVCVCVFVLLLMGRFSRCLYIGTVYVCVCVCVWYVCACVCLCCYSWAGSPAVST